MAQHETSIPSQEDLEYLQVIDVLQAMRLEDEERWYPLLQSSDAKFALDEIVRFQQERLDHAYFRHKLSPLYQSSIACTKGATSQEALDQIVTVLDIVSSLCQSEPELVRVRMLLAFFKEFGRTLDALQKHQTAIDVFKYAIQSVMLGSNGPSFLSQNFYNTNYLNRLRAQPGDSRMAIFLDLVYCCLYIASIHLTLKNGPNAEVSSWYIFIIRINYMSSHFRPWIGFTKLKCCMSVSNIMRQEWVVREFYCTYKSPVLK